MSLSKRLQERLALSGLSQAELADRVGLSRGMVSGLFTGTRGGSRSMHRIAHELGTSVEYLLGENLSPQSEFPIFSFQREELELVHIWRGLAESQKEALRTIMVELLKR
jgi:transcriptional regulator with XRE-family HTH domain